MGEGRLLRRLTRKFRISNFRENIHIREPQLVSLMEQQSAELKELKESFKELKEENAFLKKEVLGIGVSATPSNQECLGLMESKTLRQIVEETQFDLKALSVKFTSSCHEDKGSVKGNVLSKKGGEQEPLPNENAVDNAEESVETFPMVEIKHKTVEVEREWMRARFIMSVMDRSVSKGASMEETMLEEFASSINSDRKSSDFFLQIFSCASALTLSNFSSNALTDTTIHILNGSKISGPSTVDPHTTELFAFKGQRGSCEFLCSFGLSSCLRLTLYSSRGCDDTSRFGMAFTPQDAPTDEYLYTTLKEMPSGPDIWMHMRPLTVTPVELFINHGKWLARGHMKPGTHGLIHIEILEMGEVEAGVPVRANKKPLLDGESMSSALSYGYRLQALSLCKNTGVIEIANCLNSTLKNHTEVFANSARNTITPIEVGPFSRETFFASYDTTLEAIFSYEIEFTDLCIIVSLQVREGDYSFVAAFAPLPDEENRWGPKWKLDALMDPKGWKTHLYKKHAQARDGEQVIQIRNIQASVRMMEEAEPLLNIRVFAV